MKQYMKLYRLDVSGHWKVALKIWDRTIDDINPLSVIVLDDVPKGLRVGVNYSLESN